MSTPPGRTPPPLPTHPGGQAWQAWQAWQETEQGWGRDGLARVGSDQHRIFFRPISRDFGPAHKHERNHHES
jgi:hypothetical protein